LESFWTHDAISMKFVFMQLLHFIMSENQHFLLVFEIHVATITSPGFRLRVLLANEPESSPLGGALVRLHQFEINVKKLKTLALDS
jgi:hypothetical protein